MAAVLSSQSWPGFNDGQAPRALDPLEPDAECLLAGLVGWAVAGGRMVAARSGHLFAEALWAAVRSDGESPFLWSRVRVYEFLRSEFPRHCRTRYDEPEPADAAEVLWLFLAWLSWSDRFAEGSDELEPLRQPLHCFGGLNLEGRWQVRSFGSTRWAARREACQCFIPTERHVAREPWRPDGISRQRRAG